ncbi:hypothetical protein [Novosphingobium gossypii]|uniref:hypothetical protein n=1 Tax=Novosphingobium gossypii TaxID=1604774 RepID=UPI003D1E60DE
MVLKTVGPLALTLLAAPAPVAAQTIIPIISPGQAAEGIFSRSRSETDARRPREGDSSAQPDAGASPTPMASAHPEPGTPEFHKQACDNRPVYRRQYGEDDPQVQKLEAMCKASGY